MPLITLEAIQTKQTELAALIQQFLQQAAQVTQSRLTNARSTCSPANTTRAQCLTKPVSICTTWC